MNLYFYTLAHRLGVAPMNRQHSDEYGRSADGEVVLWYDGNFRIPRAQRTIIPPHVRTREFAGYVYGAVRSQLTSR